MKQVDKQLIARLLARYMEGQTTIEEEDVLNAYFHASHRIPEEWETYRRMFCYYDTACIVETHRAQSASIWKWAAVALLLLLVGVATWLWKQNEQALGQPQLAQRTENLFVDKHDRGKSPVSNVINAEMPVREQASAPIAKRPSHKGISETLVEEVADSAEMALPSDTEETMETVDPRMEASLSEICLASANPLQMMLLLIGRENEELQLQLLLRGMAVGALGLSTDLYGETVASVGWYGLGYGYETGLPEE
ncbi:MAG: hypothetical protein ACI3YX_04160 [Prevotella sp.]